MIPNVLVDTGPLIALIDRRERWHAWVCAQFGEIRPPLVSCEAVLTEACYLARRTDRGVQAVLDLFERGVVRLAFSLHDHLSPVASLMERYAGMPMSVADACLVRMCEIVPDSMVLTLDKEFRIYRKNRRQRIPLRIPPEV